jgi:hypothetical protein
MSGNTIEIGTEDRWFAGDVDVNVSAEQRLKLVQAHDC